MIIGIDLAGSPKRPSGLCMFEGLKVKTTLLYSDKELLEVIKTSKPEVIAIDAPLSLPLGRKNLRRQKPAKHFRQCDLELLKRKIKFFPITLGAMRCLTRRGIQLKHRLKQLGYKVIEVYPGGAQDVLGIPRKPKQALLKGLRRLGLKGLSKKMSKHELDAITCALVGRYWLRGCYEALGSPREGQIIMPVRKA